MNRIKILDCTLRDGGYVNDWNFGEDNINDITASLIKSGVDYVECGFLSDSFSQSKDITLYKTLKDVYSYNNFKNFTFMVNYGEFDFERISDGLCGYELRLAFKPFHLKNLYEYVMPLVEKNIKFSLNPMHISLYSAEDIDLLCDITNKSNPVCLTGVDTMGIMNEVDTKCVFECLDINLKPAIALGFHSHNNLDLSLKNTLSFLAVVKERQVIVDASLGGLARGGGMLSTELFADYLNKNYGTNYDLALLNKTISKIILPIKHKYGTDDKYPYYLSAKYGCHPNYAKSLASMEYNFDNMSAVLNSIPKANRPYYNVEVLKKSIEECRVLN